MHDGTCTPTERTQRQLRLGKAIRAARLPLTQVELARQLGCPQSSISMWENGKVTLTAEQIHWLEGELELTAGQLLLEAGYIDPALPVAREQRSSRPVRPPARWRSRVDGSASFPVRVAGWLEDFGALIDAICVLRDSAADDTALNALLDSQPILMLRLGWELWEVVGPEVDDEPSVAMAAAIGRSTLAKCQYALWGVADQSGGGTVRLRAVL